MRMKVTISSHPPCSTQSRVIHRREDPHSLPGRFDKIPWPLGDWNRLSGLQDQIRDSNGQRRVLEIDQPIQVLIVPLNSLIKREVFKNRH